MKLSPAEAALESGIPFAKFDLQTWRRAMTLPSDFRPPEGAGTKIVLDPSWSSNSQSDESALVCGYWEPDNEDGAPNSFVFVDALSGKYAGLQLVTATLDFVQQWNPFYFSIETAAGRESPLLVDVLKEKAIALGVKLPCVEVHSAGGTPWSKARRIAKLKTHLLDENRLKIRKGAFIDKLMTQVTKFDFTFRDNQCREDGLVDALSRCAGFN
jgi:hypothetical protein